MKYKYLKLIKMYNFKIENFALTGNRAEPQECKYTGNQTKSERKLFFASTETVCVKFIPYFFSLL